jgi:deaminated glutathione amidase
MRGVGRGVVRVAAVQTTAVQDRSGNLDAAAVLVDAAVDSGAELVVLPEYFSVAGDPDFLRTHAEPLEGPTAIWASALARRRKIWLVAGSFPEEPAPPGGRRGGTSGRLFNTSCLIDPTGSVAAAYRKIHLFDVGLGNTQFCESATVAPGEEVTVAALGESSGDANLPAPAVGLSLCYDLRFPEMYRIMTLLGATVIVVPAAFTAATGPSHWELLLRARAAENQVFVIGAGQVGDLPPGMPKCHGHSMIVDPWGSVIAERTESTAGFVLADLDFSRQQQIRRDLPVLANRRPEAYRWPDE